MRSGRAREAAQFNKNGGKLKTNLSTGDKRPPALLYKPAYTLPPYGKGHLA